MHKLVIGMTSLYKEDRKNMNIQLIRSAIVFAADAHGRIDQRRKFTGEPYITHPIAVARMTAAISDDAEMIAAAVLHDTVEDTPVCLEDIEVAFGSRVAELVGWVTYVSKPEDGNRETRKALDRRHLADAPAEAQTIKLADLIHNTQSIVQHNPDFARVYLKEKLRLLEVLTRGHRQLYGYALSLARMGSETTNTIE
jgi:(p)ppGpp synthase/HD superfamily hydrolase